MANHQEILAKVRELLQVAKDGATSEDQAVCFAKAIEIMAWFPEIAASYEQMHSDILEAKEALSNAEKKLSIIPCYQGCNGGVIQTGEGECEQCQWCDEIEREKQFLKKLDHYTSTT